MKGACVCIKLRDNHIIKKIFKKFLGNTMFLRYNILSEICYSIFSNKNRYNTTFILLFILIAIIVLHYFNI